MDTLNLNIGPEKEHMDQELPKNSPYMLDLRSVDHPQKKEAHKDVTVDLKQEEIKMKSKKQPGRICVVGKVPEAKKGLGRLPMITGALMMILFLNMGQMIFLGKQTGQETIALAGEVFNTMQSAGHAFLSGEEGSDVMLFEEASELITQMEIEAAPLLAHQSAWLSEPKEVQSIRALLEAGHLVTEIGVHVSEARRGFETMPEEGSITDHIEGVSVSHLEPAAEKIATINTLMDRVDLSRTPYQEKFDDFRFKFEEASSVFDLWVAAKEPVLTVLGADLPQHYLILLKNNDEMRMGGGFIGSFAIAELNDGRLTNLDFHDVYDFDDRFYDEIEIPVHELRLLTDNWRLRDSNISPDFPTTAKHAMRFLELEGGPGVDGVIAVNLSAAQGLMEATGPLTVPTLDKPLTSENFPTVLSTLVEAKVTGDSTPKTILGELLNSFKEAAGSNELRLSLGNTMLEQINKKQIQIYHRDSQVQDFIVSLGLDGSIPKLGEMEEDFFMPLFTNIGGNKSDRYMQTQIAHDTHIMDDGSMVVAATIERTHQFNDAAKSWVTSTMKEFGFNDWTEGLWKVIGNDRNRTGIRLYLPEGVQFLEVQGAHRDDFQFFYDKEMDISYFYYDQTVQPGTTESFTAFFQLPYTLGDDSNEYHFNLFKQPGLKNVTYAKTVQAPNHMMLSSYPLATESQEGVDYTLRGSFNNDVTGELLFR